MTSNRREILQYLSASGYADTELDTVIDRALRLVEQAVRPKMLHDVFPCEPRDGGVTVGGRFFAGRDLQKNLTGCCEVILLAVTLGAEADLLLRREAVRGALPAAVMQAVLAEQTERAADLAQQRAIASHAAGKRTRARFSLGYGDTRLSDQERFFALLPISKRMGVTLTDGFLMLPSKSVTAFVGIVSE